MADSILGDFPAAKCSDCGKLGCVFQHWGPLVPSGQIGTFCVECAQNRIDAWNKKNTPKPIGYKLQDVSEHKEGGV